MSNEPTSTPDYTMGYDENFQQLLNRRSVENNAAHLLPHLMPGMRVLDFGCGPGTISVGLAKAIEPGEFHGIDMEESQVEMARTAANAGGHENATFHVGDAGDLPFDDDYFDVVHSHTVLNHIPDTQAALLEVMRVLKPGGIVSARDIITSSSFTGPDFQILDRTWTIFGNRMNANNAHADMGRELKNEFHVAGFSSIDAGASIETFTTKEDVDFIYGVINGRMLEPASMQSDIDRGISTREVFDELQAAFNIWREHPGAIAGLAWGWAIGRKPE